MIWIHKWLLYFGASLYRSGCDNATRRCLGRGTLPGGLRGSCGFSPVVVRWRATRKPIRVNLVCSNESVVGAVITNV